MVFVPTQKFGICVALATSVFMSVLGPTTEILFFACPKKSIQKKRHPDAASSLRSSLSPGVAERGFLPLRQRDSSMNRPFGLNPPKAPVLGAAYGINPRHSSSQGKHGFCAHTD